MDIIYNLIFRIEYLVICLVTDTIDDLILYLGSEKGHALDF